MASRRYRSFSQSSSKRYIMKESLGKEEEEFNGMLCCPTTEVFNYCNQNSMKLCQGASSRGKEKGG
jgi:hypothetical protein